MFDPTSSIDTLICGMNQTASMQIVFDLKIKGIGIELATIPSPQTREAASETFRSYRNADSSHDNCKTPGVAIHLLRYRLSSTPG
jgi:hypothetical protein